MSQDLSESGAQHVGLGNTFISPAVCVPDPLVHTVPRTCLLILCLQPAVDLSEFVHTAGQNFDRICTKSAAEIAEDFTFEELFKEVSDGIFTHAFVIPPVGTFTAALRGLCLLRFMDLSPSQPARRHRYAWRPCLRSEPRRSSTRCTS